MRRSIYTWFNEKLRSDKSNVETGASSLLEQQHLSTEEAVMELQTPSAPKQQSSKCEVSPQSSNVPFAVDHEDEDISATDIDNHHFEDYTNWFFKEMKGSSHVLKSSIVDEEHQVIPPILSFFEDTTKKINRIMTKFDNLASDFDLDTPKENK